MMTLFKKGPAAPESFATAEAALAQYDKASSAIEKEVAALSGLLRRRIDAERDLSKAEVADALGEANDVRSARKAVEEARAQVDHKSRLLHGLRDRLLGFSSVLADRHKELTADLPAYYQELIDEFTAEWAEASAAFGRVLSKRRALEELTGRALVLTEPTAGAFDLGAAAKPGAAAKGLRDAVEILAATHKRVRSATHSETISPGEKLALYDPSKVYVMVRASRGYPEGMLVCDASFDRGLLRSKVQSGWAVEADADREARNTAGAVALKALRDIEASERQDRQFRDKDLNERLQFERDLEAATRDLGQLYPDDPAKRVRYWKREGEFALALPEPQNSSTEWYDARTGNRRSPPDPGSVV